MRIRRTSHTLKLGELGGLSIALSKEGVPEHASDFFPPAGGHQAWTVT